jgi:hypothetical protein
VLAEMPDGKHSHECRPRPIAPPISSCRRPAVTLRSAIESANTTPGDNTINLTVAGTYKITIPGRNEDLNASGDFDIIPNPASPAGSTLLIQKTAAER